MEDTFGTLARIQERQKWARYAYVAPQDRACAETQNPFARLGKPRPRPVEPKPPRPVIAPAVAGAPTALAVMATFCAVYSEIAGREYTVADLNVPLRNRAFAWPRHVCVKLVREICRLSTPQIGRLFGKRDHTTIMAALQCAPERMAARPELQAAYDRTRAAFGEAKK